nr:hypothetical protein [uncultured Acetatifactor sp.]
MKASTAIKNGIIYPYNNGLAERCVKKIKVIKRIMYGKNSFELLIAKEAVNFSVSMEEKSFR